MYPSNCPEDLVISCDNCRQPLGTSFGVSRPKSLTGCAGWPEQEQEPEEPAFQHGKSFVFQLFLKSFFPALSQNFSFFSSLLGFWRTCPPTDAGDPVVLAAKLEDRQRTLTSTFVQKEKLKRVRSPPEPRRQLFKVLSCVRQSNLNFLKLVFSCILFA